MARRNPGISPILSARGYGARVLWPKYTPDGGINSGSEVPPAPSNTLQSNNSNLIASYSNPFGVYEEQIEPGIVFEPFVSNTALNNPLHRRHNGFSGPHQEAFHHMAMRSNPGEKFEVRTKRGKTMSMSRAQVEKMGSKMLAPGEVERVLGRENPKKRYVATTYGGHGYMGGGEDDIGISTGHNVYKASSTKKAHKMAARFGAQEAPQKLRSGERAYKVTSTYGDRGQMDFLDTGRPSKMKRMAKKSDGLYSRRAVELRPGESMHEWMNPRHNPDPDGRLSPQELAAMKVQAVAMLDKKVPHAEVRKQLNLTYPKYMAVLRSGTTKRGAPTHVPDSPSHFLRMPVQDRKDKRKQAVSMLKAGTKHEDVRKSLGVGYKTYLGILRTIPNPHLYDGYHEMMSNPAMMRQNPFGG